MNDKKEEKLNEVTRNFFEAVRQLMEEACININAICEDEEDSVKETTVNKTVVTTSLRSGFFKSLWDIISEHIPQNAVITGEEILKLCWKYAPTETKEALDNYDSLTIRRYWSFQRYICKTFIDKHFIALTSRRGLYVRSDFSIPTYPKRRSVNKTTSNVVINNSPVIKVINK